MLSRLRNLVHELGLTDACTYLLARGVGRLSFGRVRLTKFYLVAQPVRADNTTPPRRGRSIVVKEIGPDEIRTLDFGRPATAIEYRLRNRCRCLVANKGDQLLGFQWFTTVDYPEDQVRCLYRLEAPDRCAWDFDIFVRPEARMLPTFLRLWDHCNALLREAGIDLSLSRIDAFNVGSRRSHDSLGARPIGWATFLTAGSLQLAVFSSRPWVHFSASPSNPPEWRVSGLARGRNRTHFSDSDRTNP